MLDDFSDCTMARTRNMDMSTCMFHPLTCITLSMEGGNYSFGHYTLSLEQPYSHNRLRSKYTQKSQSCNMVMVVVVMEVIILSDGVASKAETGVFIMPTPLET